MDTITKWDYMKIYSRNDDTEVRALCHKGWEPVGIDDGHVILKRPCGEISITKHPEIWQSPDQNTDMDVDGIEY